MDDYKPTTYQTIGASNWTEVEFRNESTCTIVHDRQRNEIIVKAPLAEWSITIEQEIFLKALQDAGIILA